MGAHSYGVPEIDALLNRKPETRRRESSGDLLDDAIVGILIGYSAVYKHRDGWIDLVTTGYAKEEIIQLIKDCGGDPSKIKR